MSQQINLFNPIFMKQKKYFSVATMLQALGLIVLGSTVFYAYAVYQVSQLSKQAEEMSKRYASEQARLANFTNEFSLQRSAQMLDEQLKQLEAQAKSQEAVLAMLKSGAIGNTQGYSEYMRAFARQSINGLWLTGFDIIGDGTQISLSGAVVNPQLVPSFIQRLGKERVMQGKTFSTLQMQQPKKDGDRAVPRYVEFNLRSTAIPDEARK
ncbi:PilN domain-containing protein [Sideroxydans lithotrophicus]|uniref:Putative mannose-sensitive agglutinin (MSHA) n=1 Tax=Sideroxydans lithotrophicus (strain ES-1) TaxID=580332 RepID=D5CNC4_SIDLE|nr:PilN domain-containing protein [Sideroxydans lithotrophicus]ADE12821.1 putative mannose-sensitive agglutinin (MSHA) [Sideroxydans lithotrophicus ES-1]